MKIVYKLSTGNWQDTTPEDLDDVIAQANVPDEVEVAILNRASMYTADGWDPELYADTIKQLDIRNALAILESTDYIPVQWADETALGIEHNRTEEDYLGVLQQRQDAREVIRSHNPAE